MQNTTAEHSPDYAGGQQDILASLSPCSVRLVPKCFRGAISTVVQEETKYKSLCVFVWGKEDTRYLSWSARVGMRNAGSLDPSVGFICPSGKDSTITLK